MTRNVILATAAIAVATAAVCVFGATTAAARSLPSPQETGTMQKAQNEAHDASQERSPTSTGGSVPAQPSPADAAPAGYDEALAQRLGADELGMRPYVLVILKSSSTPVPAGPERDAMFRGHFENMGRLAKEGTLAFAGPLDGVEGRRGIFILAVPDIEEAKALVGTDPVVSRGEMVAEYHKLYGSAALMQVNEVHERIAKKSIF